MTSSTATRTALSLTIAAASFGLAYYAPMGASKQTITVVAGSELQEPLMLLEKSFERDNPNLAVELKFQGSQDMINRYVDDKNDFEPTILMPANGELLNELSSRWQAQNQDEAFYGSPQAIAKTQLVAIAWPQRGKVLFPSGQFNWERLGEAIEAKTWDKLGGDANWGSFDFLTTDPTRSNSGQLTLSLWAQAKTGNSSINNNLFNQPEVQALFSSIKQSVYQPPRSTDILLQEFIARGPNDADIATVYESIALHRWEQSAQGSREPYQIYYLTPTIETQATAAVVKRNVDRREAKAAQKFLDYLSQSNQQEVFIQQGFRPIDASINLATVKDSPWGENIPGAAIAPTNQAQRAPSEDSISELIRTWQRAQ